MKNILSLLFILVTSYSFGQQLVYTAKNPAFGGATFNYNWLLNSANAQNQFEDPAFGDLGDLTALNESLNNQFLNQGTDGLPTQTGTSSDGNLEFEVFETIEGIIINILDITTGEQTQIIIPN
ncbi:MAG: curli assembly protein CsgF [Bacteroidetes bacterium]|nr:curli assembly protein CsgF [Bacteroidota bacterium]